MAKCPHCEKAITLKKGKENQICRQTEGTLKKEIMYSCPYCDKVIGFGFFIGGLLTGRP
jgi:primosomal protein N'